MSGTIHLGLFKALPLVLPMKLAHRRDRGKKTYPMTPCIAPGLSQDSSSTVEAGAITTNSWLPE